MAGPDVSPAVSPAAPGSEVGVFRLRDPAAVFEAHAQLELRRRRDTDPAFDEGELREAMTLALERLRPPPSLLPAEGDDP